MAKNQSTKRKTASSAPYLTKRVLVRAIDKSTRKLSSNALQQRGSIVTVEKGWVVKKHSNGETDKVKKLPSIKRSLRIALD